MLVKVKNKTEIYSGAPPQITTTDITWCIDLLGACISGTLGSRV